MGEELELREFVVKQLEIRRKILSIVKKYVVKIFVEVFGMDPEELKRSDPSTYYAIGWSSLEAYS